MLKSGFIWAELHQSCIWSVGIIVIDIPLYCIILPQRFQNSLSVNTLLFGAAQINFPPLPHRQQFAPAVFRMGKKRRHDTGGAGLDASQKKQKHSASSSDNFLLSSSTSSRVGQSLSQVNQCQKDTRDLAPEPISDADREAHGNPQQVSRSTQAQVQDPRLAGNQVQYKYSSANSGYAGLGKTLNFPVFHQRPSDASTQHRPFSHSATASFYYSTLQWAPFDPPAASTYPRQGSRVRCVHASGLSKLRHSLKGEHQLRSPRIPRRCVHRTYSNTSDFSSLSKSYSR